MEIAKFIFFILEISHKCIKMVWPFNSKKRRIAPPEPESSSSESENSYDSNMQERINDLELSVDRLIALQKKTNETIATMQKTINSLESIVRISPFSQSPISQAFE
jgi:hypothetical protein